MELNRIKKLNEIAKSLDYEFRVITIVKPSYPTIEIEWLAGELLQYFVYNQQDIIDSSSTHSVFEEIDSLVIQSIEITDSETSVFISGDALASLNTVQIQIFVMMTAKYYMRKSHLKEN